MQNWPFDNLCHTTGEDFVIANATLWQEAGAGDGRVWRFCKEKKGLSAVFGDWWNRRGAADSLAMWAEPKPWMSPGHQRACRIYSIGSLIITIALALFFWGRSAIDLARHLFYTKVIPKKEGEALLPTFTEGGSKFSAYIPQVKDPSYMFPLLATDISTMDTQNIPWACDYALNNIALDIGEEAVQKGLMRKLSVVQRYTRSGPKAAAEDSLSL